MVSVWHQSTARVIRKRRIHLLYYRSRGTLMSYADHSVQRRFKSNTLVTQRSYLVSSQEKNILAQIFYSNVKAFYTQLDRNGQNTVSNTERRE